jgi:hypothetical protein
MPFFFALEDSMVDLPLDIAGKPFKDNEYKIIMNNDAPKN